MSLIYQWLRLPVMDKYFLPVRPRFQLAERMSLMSSQRGTVLIIALLVVAVITGLAIDFAGRFQLSLSRAENRFFTNQMQQSLFSIEHASMWALREDKEGDVEDGNQNYDYLEEDWAKAEQYQQLIQAEFGDVLINSVSIEDAQGRFNINQMGISAEKYDPSQSFDKNYTPQQRRFIRLLQTVPNNVVGSTEAEEIAQAVIDWIDSDNNVTGAGGAESDFYASQDQPYRAANQIFVSVSELRLVKGVTEEIYEHIAPLIVAIPDTAAGINVNTVSSDIMRSLNSKEETVPLSEEDGKTLESSRPVKVDRDSEDDGARTAVNDGTKKQEGFTKVEDFLDSNDIGTIFGSDVELHPEVGGLTTGSNYFLLSTELEINGVTRRGVSLLKRDTDQNTGKIAVRVVRRSSEDVF